MVAFGISWILYRLAALVGQVRWGIRAGFLALIGSLTAYSFFAYQVSRNPEYILGSISRSVVIFTLIGAIFGFAITFIWHAIAERRVRKSVPED